MKATLFVCLIVFTFTNCKKEQNRQLLNAYFNFKANGVPVSIKDGAGLNENTFECILKGDTTLYVNVSKQYESAGFYIHTNNIKDGTYALDSINVGYYLSPDDKRRYTTNGKSVGTLTIRRGTFQAKSMLNTIEGTFEFTGEDTITKKKYMITEGSFLMERQDE